MAILQRAVGGLIVCLCLAVSAVCVQAISPNDVANHTIPAITTDEDQSGTGKHSEDPPSVAVPEASTLSMLFLGFTGLGGLMWLRRSRRT